MRKLINKLTGKTAREAARVDAAMTDAGNKFRFVSVITGIIAVLFAIASFTPANAQVSNDNYVVVQKDFVDTIIEGFNKESGYGYRDMGGFYMKAYKEDKTMVIEMKFSVDLLSAVPLNVMSSELDKSFDGPSGEQFRQIAKLINSLGYDVMIVIKNSDGKIILDKLI